VIRSEPFRRFFRTAAVNGHRLLFVREGGNAAFDVADAGTVVASTLRSVAPKVARQIPKNADAQLIELRKRSFAAGTLRFADHVRVFGFVLLPVAIVLFALAVFLAPDRRRAVTRLGVALGVAGGALAIGLIVLRALVLDHVDGTDELTNGDVRGAIGGIWDAYLGDPLVWTLGVGALALLVAAASDSLLKPFAPGPAWPGFGGCCARRPLRPGGPSTAASCSTRRLHRPPADPRAPSGRGGRWRSGPLFRRERDPVGRLLAAQHDEAVAARATHRRGWAIAGVTAWRPPSSGPCSY
jgi:hypothetical protein